MKDRMYPIIVSTCCCLWLMIVQVLDGKPYAGKRLSYEGMDWNFGGWTPLDGGGGGGGFTGISSLAHHPTLTQHFSSPPLGLLNNNDPSSVMDSDMIQFLKQVPSSVTPPPELHGLDPQTNRKPHYQQQQQQSPLSSIVSQVNDSPSSPLRALRFLQQQSPAPSQQQQQHHHHQQQGASSSSWPLSVNSNNNNNSVSGSMPSSSQSILSQSAAPAQSSLSYAIAHDAPTKIRVEPKPLREAQIEAYKVIEQLESDAEKQKQILSAQGPTYLPLDIPTASQDSYNSQGQAMSYSVSSSSSRGESRRKSNSGYSNSNSINYNSQRQTETHQTLAIPVKEIGKDYVTLPVAVETDEDKVLTPQEINEIEKEVLKAIPESLGNPDMMYEAAIPLDEMSNPEQYMMQNAPGYGSNNGGKTNAGGNRWPKIPKFMSALSPSKVKISDLLRPLLRKVRPGQLPPSPSHQIHGMPASSGYGGGFKGGSNAPMIPAGTPYSNSGHRPENLDVIHLIAGPANTYQPAIIHVSQLVRHKNRGPMSGGKKKKKMRNKKKSGGLNNPGFNPYPGFEGAAAPPLSMPFAQYQSSPFGGNGYPFSQGMNPYQSPVMRPSAVPSSGSSYGQQSGIKGGGKGMTTYQVMKSNQQESYEINHGSPQQQSNGYNTQPQLVTGYSGPSTGNNNYEEMISMSLPPNPPPQSYGQSYSELSNMPPAPFQHVNQRPQPSHQSSSSQSYGPMSGNQKEYIEVINLPPRGGQSVEYNPGPTPSSGNYNSGNQGYSDNPGSRQQSGYIQGQSYSAASSLPSSTGYGDQSSNNNPSYESNQNSAPSSPSSSTSYGDGPGGASGATIELIDGSTSPNFNYKGVTSLNPKELVELIAKQVPALKDVLTPGHSNSDQGSSGYGNSHQGPSSGYQSQNSGADVSYEVIQMPPIYHNKERETRPDHQPQEPNYSPAVNYASKGQESGEVSYEGSQGNNGGNGNYQQLNGYTQNNQESGYSPQSSQSSSSSSSSSSEQSSYQPPYESPSAYDQHNQERQNLHSPSVQYSNNDNNNNNMQNNYEQHNNNYMNHNYDSSSSNNNNQYISDESQRSNVITSKDTSSSVNLPSSSSSPSSSYKFGQRLSSTPELSSSSSSAEETLSQPPSPTSSTSSTSIRSGSSSESGSVLSQLYSSEDTGRVKVSPVKVLTKESEEDEFKEDSNLGGLLLSESTFPLPSPSSSSSQETSKSLEESSEAKSRK